MEPSSDNEQFQMKTKSACDNIFTTAAASSRKCHSSRRVSSFFPKGYLAVVVIVVIITLHATAPVRSATLKKRSAEQSEENCRSNAICGWEVYHPSTRSHQYYVASSCKCSSEKTCIRVEDDVSISAYVFRCRGDRRRRKTTSQPEVNEILL